MNPKSEWEIKRWQEYKEKYLSGKWKGGIEAFNERLSGYLCSLILGRDFLEDPDEYFKRKGLTEFDNWARQELHRNQVFSLA